MSTQSTNWGDDRRRVCEEIFDIPYIKLNFTLEILADTALPRTKVSALRGGLGEMLLLQNCVRDRNCDQCFFQSDCVVWDTFYSRMERRPAYVTGKESVGYLIECDNYRTAFPAGSRLGFSLILFGSAIAFFNLYLQAFVYLGMVGLGKERSRYRVLTVTNEGGEIILADECINMGNYRLQTVADYVNRRKRRCRQPGETLQISFITPLSMKHQGEFLQELAPEALLAGAARRLQMLNYYLGREVEQPKPGELPIATAQEVKRDTVRRYSSTSDAQVRLNGIRGSVILANVSEVCLDLLLAGELTHIGKNTSFGFGKYHVLMGG